MEVEPGKSKRIAKNTIYLYVRMFLTLIVSLYTVRVILNILSVTDYGIYGAVGGVVASLGFITNTLANASQRYFSYEIGKGEKGKTKEVFNSFFILYFLASIIVAIAGEIIGIWFIQHKMLIPLGRENAAMWVFHFSLASFIISLIANPYQAMIIAKEKMNLYAYISILDVILKLSIVYLLFVIDWDKLIVYSVLLFLSSLITNTIYFVYCHKYKETHITFKFDIGLIKSVLGYSTWTILGTLAGMFNTQGLNIMLNLFFGPVANAAYLIGSQVSTHSSLFANNFFTAIRPAIIKSYSAGDYETVNKYCMFSTKVVYLFMAIIILPLTINTEEVLTLWLGNISPYMVLFVRLSMIYALILSLSNPITTIVQAQGNVKLYHGIVDGFGLIALPISYLLFKFGFDAYWGYMTMIIVFSISHMLRIYVIKKVYPIFNVHFYYCRIILPIVFTSTLSYYSMLLINSYFGGSFFELCISCITAAFIVTIISLMIILSKKERLSIYNLLIKRISR